MPHTEAPTRASIIDDFGPVIKELAQKGAPRTEVIARFSLVEPTILPETIQAALVEMGVIFNVDRQQFNFAIPSMEAALWNAIAVTLNLPSSPSETLLGLDIDEAQAISEELAL